MNTFTDTLWNNFNKRHQWIFDAAEKIRAQDKAIALSRTVAGAPAGLSRCASQAKPLIDYRKEAPDA